MDKVLLIIFDWNLRQLYHELLLSKDLEVTPTDSIENAILLLTMTEYQSVVIYTDETASEQVLTLLQLRKKHVRWTDPLFIILSADADMFQKWLKPTDLI